MMRTIRSRIAAWLARRYHARLRNNGFDLVSADFLPDSALMALRRDDLDPVAQLGRARDETPVRLVKLPLGLRFWLVSGYDAARAVLGNATDFSNDFGQLAGVIGIGQQRNPGGLGFADPPEHTRLRRLLTPEFTRRRLSRLAPRVESIVSDQLEAMAGAEEPVDLWRWFALPIPYRTICELLGIPEEDRDELQRLSTLRFDLLGGAGGSLDAISQSLTVLQSIVGKQRQEPGDGLLGRLIMEHGDEVDDRELAGLADGVLTGGLESTASMLALGALVLLRDPDSRDLVRNDDAVDGFVEELLRYLTVVQVAFPRIAARETTVGDVTIPRGDIVVVSLSAANRDPVLGGDLDRLDPTREHSPHLAFGYGLHRCIGAELARMELRTAYPALVRRFPAMRLAVDSERLPFRQTSIVYGLDSLPVLLSSVSPSPAAAHTRPGSP